MDTPPPKLGRCLAHPDKRAAPAEFRLGTGWTLALTVEGTCPGQAEPAQVAIVLDTSYSMAGNMAFREARYGAVRQILASLDPDVTEVSLITFGDGASLQVPLTRHLDDIAGSLTLLVPDGDTHMAAGIGPHRPHRAHRAALARRHPRVMLLVSDSMQGRASGGDGKGRPDASGSACMP